MSLATLARTLAPSLLRPAGAASAVALRGLATDASRTSGVPADAFEKRVLIFSPARTAGQQGLAKTIEGDSHPWSIRFPTDTKWENPLMGWTSTADSHENVARASSGMKFRTQEEAIAYCKKMGYAYDVKEPKLRNKTRTARFATYGDNFSTRRGGVPDGGLRSEIAHSK